MYLLLSLFLTCDIQSAKRKHARCPDCLSATSRRRLCSGRRGQPPAGDAFVLGDVVSHHPETPLFWAKWSATSRRRLCSGRRGQPPSGDAFVLGEVVSHQPETPLFWATWSALADVYKLVPCAGLEFDLKTGPQLAVRVQARPRPAIMFQARPGPGPQTRI